MEPIETLTVFEGIVSVRALIEASLSGSNDRKIVKILYDETKTAAKAKEFGWLSHRAEEMGFSLETVSPDAIDSVTNGKTHGGIAAFCGERSFPDASLLKKESGSFLVWMEGIEDPYNFGYSIRSLYACGADALLLSPRNWMSAAGIVCRSSAGASERIPMYTVTEPENTVRHLKEEGFRIVCADLRDAVPLSETELKKPLLLIVGGEKRGISRSLLDLSDTRVAIDYGRTFGESLSAASAAAIFGYEICRVNKR